MKCVLCVVCGIIDLDIVLGEVGQLGVGDDVSLFEFQVECVEQGFDLWIYGCVVVCCDIVMECQYDICMFCGLVGWCVGCKYVGDYD